MKQFKPGDRVLVTDNGLAMLRKIMEEAGEPYQPNHHGTVDEVHDDGAILINFDDGGSAPYDVSEVEHL